MNRQVYRGISRKEAQAVVANQKYKRSESREFQNGVQAKSIFGSGVYLISDYERAAQYAFCHAEFESDDAAVVLKQNLTLKNPFILNHRYPESRLRKDAFNWKFSGEDIPVLDISSNSLDVMVWIGSVIREYLLHHNYDGIVYHISDDLIYYVSYFQEKQIENITFDFAFEIKELQNYPVTLLRENYKKKCKIS